MPTITLQQGVDGYTGTKDTWIRNTSPTYNFGAGTVFRAGDVGIGTADRGLISFDISSIPPGAIITAATLKLYCVNEDSTTDFNVSVYRVLRAWGEGTGDNAGKVADTGESSWNDAEHDISAWGTAGCANTTTDRAAVATDSIAITSPAAWYNWNVLADVLAWHGGAANEGLCVINDSEGSANSRKNFRSKDYLIAYRPILEVVFSLPPTIVSVIPNTGSELGGTSVTIAGTDFQSGATVTFGGDAATSVVFVDSTEITCDTPAHAPGVVDVVVTNPDTGADTLVGGFTYLPSGPTIYYVDGVGGNDGNTGLSWGQAWKTLGQANLNVGDSDSVFVKAATYNEQLVLDDEVNWQAFTHPVIVDGTALSGTGIQVTSGVSGKDITITRFIVEGFTSGPGFEVQGTNSILGFSCVSRGNQKGLEIDANATFIVEGTCEFKSSTGVGIEIASSNASLEVDGKLLVFNNGGQGITCLGAGSSIIGDLTLTEIWNNANGIYWSTGAHGTFNGLKIYGNTYDGFYFNEDADGLIIEFSDVYSNGREGISSGSSALSVTDVRIRRNRIYKNGRDGIFIDDDAEDIRIYRNTLWKNGRHGIYFHPAAATNSFISSCIIASDIEYGIDTDSPLLSLIRKNCFDFNKAAVYDGSEHEGEDVGTGNIDADPVMEDPDGTVPNFELRSTSPCIGTGEEEPS